MIRIRMSINQYIKGGHFVSVQHKKTFCTINTSSIYYGSCTLKIKYYYGTCSLKLYWSYIDHWFAILATKVLYNHEYKNDR